MSSVLLKLSLFVEAGFTVFLVTVLIAIRPYFRSQAFFYRWMWAWTAHAATLAVGLSLIGAEWGTPLLRSCMFLASVILGMLFIPLLIAGAEAFRNSGRDALVARAGIIAALAATSLIFLLSILAGSGSLLGFEIRTIPKELATSGALLYCAYVFLGNWRRTASSGSLLALVSCGAYGAVRTLFALFTVAGGTLNVGWIAMDMLCQGGIAIATLLLILEHKAQAEATLRESEQRYRLLFERNLAGVLRSRVDGTLIDCNEALCKSFGYASCDELQRQNMYSIYGDPGERRAMMASLLATGQLINREVRFRRKDGSEMISLVSVNLIAGSPGADVEASTETMELQGTVLDISEVHRLKEHLFQAQKMEAIGSFAGGVAHDFNNLLTVITAYCELLADGLSDAAQREQAAGALKACWRAADLTKQLLMFSRRQPIAPRELNLSAVIGDLSGMLRRLLDKNIELRFELEENLSRCLADATHIQQIVMNLAANARDAMPHGGRLLIQTSHAVLDSEQAARLSAPIAPGDYVVLTVSDSGTGIDPAIQARIFEPFFTTKELGKGTGLGLSTVYGIVKQNNGFIFVESEPGQGATFRIYLPQLCQAPLASDPAPLGFSHPGNHPASMPASS